MAPCATSAAFYAQARGVWAAAAAAGLSPQRATASTATSPTRAAVASSRSAARAPRRSPFVRYPHVLPALIRYVNNHPSLSYWFASECVGSASQGPRPDEGARERWDELGVSPHLARAARRPRRASARAALARARPAARRLRPATRIAPSSTSRSCGTRTSPSTARVTARWAWSSCARCACPSAPGMLAALAALVRGRSSRGSWSRTIASR